MFHVCVWCALVSNFYIILVEEQSETNDRLAVMYAWWGVLEGLSTHTWIWTDNRTIVLEQVHRQICTNSSRCRCRHISNSWFPGNIQNHMNITETRFGTWQKNWPLNYVWWLATNAMLCLWFSKPLQRETMAMWGHLAAQQRCFRRVFFRQICEDVEEEEAVMMWLGCTWDMRPVARFHVTFYLRIIGQLVVVTLAWTICLALANQNLAQASLLCWAQCGICFHPAYPALCLLSICTIFFAGRGGGNLAKNSKFKF